MSYISLDVEADGPIPGTDKYSMISLGAVLVEPGLTKTFRANLRPISPNWIPAALAVSGVTREQAMAFPEASIAMKELDAWIQSVCPKRPLFVSDNNAFDWQFTNWYFWHFLGRNPFGHSSTNLGSLYKGMQKNVFVNFKHLRKTAHTHDPLDDAKGNAEALLTMRTMGLKF